MGFDLKTKAYNSLICKLLSVFDIEFSGEGRISFADPQKGGVR